MTRAASTTWPGGALPADGSAAPPQAEREAADVIAPPEADALPVACVATRGPLFGLALRTGALTVLTLGFYRFWMKTRLRRWYWSSVRPGGLPMEYVGEPLEKLLGFLVAVVILAFYIGVVNLLLMFVSLSVFAGSAPAFLMSLLGVIPLWFYARYRARRYVLARTRWRGLRFGLEPGAWGYALRALGHWLAVILTLGLLWPRMTFGLEKYRTDRTFFGGLRLHQGGRWTMLLPAFGHVMGGAVFSVVFVLAAFDGAPDAFWMLGLSVPWLVFGLVHYSVEATRLMANAKTAGPLALDSRPRTGKIARIYLFGGLAALISLLIPLAVAGLLLAGAEATFAGILESHPALLAVAGAALYIALALIWSTLRHVFLTMPVWRHYAETLTVTGAVALPETRQRARDPFAEAEGFAEALDVGAAI
ncbi:DUF898 family protein [Roseisalinus antarcticus]|uniref:Inner membrane protein YjgN n=1 Tax=Roseisalinus antarcticus TaxID=254357 RepID=A0A1Y5SPW9_9RHOB|nr:DUF898 family protein [Roseisalinus antarcticus]SLN45534.1 hypothetical protein ROA7023_01889 [Roseisalinus antarcticus]